VVDETLVALIPFLEDQQFSVRSLEPGMVDEVPSRAFDSPYGWATLLVCR
jgi:hypothetical protein